jgi:hypothetical protein
MDFTKPEIRTILLIDPLFFPTNDNGIDPEYQGRSKIE